MMEHIVLAIIFLFVAIAAVVAFIRQMKYKNILAIIFSVLTAVSFGFFSIATLITEIGG
jgi:cytochrome c biogenesis factor